MPNKGGALFALIEAARGRGADECWPWPRYIMRATGYGQTSYEGQPWLAHRLAYVRAYGPIPNDSQDGQPTVEHQCHTDDAGCPGGPTCSHRACVNPRHLTLLSRTANAMRGGSPMARKARLEMCERGIHPLSGDNLGTQHNYGRNDSRVCIACRRERGRASYARQRQRLVEGRGVQ